MLAGCRLPSLFVVYLPRPSVCDRCVLCTVRHGKDNSSCVPWMLILTGNIGVGGGRKQYSKYVSFCFDAE